MKKENLFPEKVDRKRSLGFRLFNVGGRLRKDAADKQPSAESTKKEDTKHHD